MRSTDTSSVKAMNGSEDSIRVLMENSLNANQMIEANITTATNKLLAKHSIESSDGVLNRQSLPNDVSLFSFKIMCCITLWYFFSSTTLFLNKYIVTYESGDATILGTVQMISCAICSFGQLYYTNKIKSKLNHSLIQSQTSKKTNGKIDLKLSNFTFNLIYVGSLRYSTIFLGLIALWYVPISFAETIKSSAPVFTVFISRYVLGEQTSLLVNLSLIPVMCGLALCSAYELSFTFLGFIASLATNLSECLQNVFSKKLLTFERYEPIQLQFYTSVSSFIIQIPCIVILVDFNQFFSLLRADKNLILIYLLAGLSFHCQSLTEYILLNIISPVTHSVANTLKRALLIWLSVLIFGNPVTPLSWIGTGIVIFGVFIYNKARNISAINNNTGTHYSQYKNIDTRDV